MSEPTSSTDAATESSKAPESGPPLRQWGARVVAPVLAVALYALLPGDMPHEARATAAVMLLMALWWMTEALPLAATALVPLVALPVLGVLEIGDAASPYASDTIFLFMGGFILGLAMQKWGLHRRIALRTVQLVGTKPVQLVGGFMVATGFVSMWVSNTATTVMMLPIGVSVLALVADAAGEGKRNFNLSLMLGIAYAASIGSLATLIGTPPNTLLRGYMSDTHGVEIGFGQWMIVGLPIAVIFLAIAWFVLTKVIYKPEMDEIPGGKELIDGEVAKLGAMSRGEWTVLVVFVCAAVSWVFIPLLADAVEVEWLGRVTDAGIAITAALALFLIPVDASRGQSAMDWDTAKELPWGVLLLFGGGLSLSAAVSASGLDGIIGEQVVALEALPVVLIVVVVAALVLFLTELTSNTATAATFLPIVGAAAIGLGLDPLVLAVPAALAATCAFMLPVATPPNAIVFGSGYVKIGEMVRAGFWLNLIGLVLITILMYSVAAGVFGLSL